ncbi:MAG: NUDIX domain-containing protein [Nanoarchaeota archaeon]
MKNNYIKKIGLLYIKNKKLLVVYKPKIGVYITPGGKCELNEADFECLKREIQEELGCSVNNLSYFGTFKGETMESSKTLKQKCYFGKLTGIIKINPNDTINSYTWINRNYQNKNVKLGKMLESQIIPKLIKGGLF